MLEAQALGGLKIHNYSVRTEFVDDHPKVVVSGSVVWEGVAPPITCKIWARLYYGDRELNRWETWYDPVHPGPYYFTLVAYDLSEGVTLRLVVGYSYLVWETVTDETTFELEYFSPSIAGVQLSVTSEHTGVLRFVCKSRYPPHEDKSVSIDLWREAPRERVTVITFTWQKGRTEAVVEVKCADEPISGYTYLPEGLYTAWLVYNGSYYSEWHFAVGYRLPPSIWDRILSVIRSPYLWLAVGVLLIGVGIYYRRVRRRRSS